MPLPTLGPIIDAAHRTARRFPLVLLAAVLAAGAGIALTARAATNDTETELVRLVLVAMLGLPLFFALTLLAERRRWGAAVRWGVSLAGVAALAAFWAFWPRWSEPVQVARYVQLSAAFHLMAAFLPFAGTREPNGFWQYNKALFLRFLTAGLYSGVLFAGLALALLALDKLFGVPVPEEGYARLWFVMAFVFTTWFFLAGVPEDLRALEARRDYPRGLSVFAQYVLVPIVVIYLTILTVYLGKVLITREWPSGWIGYLVSGVAAAGLLAWLLVRPLEDQPEHRWVKHYTRGFFLAIMPAIVMLWLAIWKRVAQYGITERRYFLIVLSLWLAGIAVYYTVRRSRSIAVIPASLCALALLTFAGPWGAYAVSRTSQTRRLAALLERNGILVGGVVRPAAREVSFEERKEISGTLEYLLRTHGGSGIAGWFDDSLKQVLSARPAGRTYANASVHTERALRRMGLRYVSAWEQRTGEESLGYSAKGDPEPVPITGYDYAVRFGPRLLNDSVPVGGRAWARYDRAARRIQIVQDGSELLTIPLDSVIRQARSQGGRPDAAEPGAPRGRLRVEARGGSGRSAAALMLLSSLHGTAVQDSVSITGIDGDLYLRLR